MNLCSDDSPAYVFAGLTAHVNISVATAPATAVNLNNFNFVITFSPFIVGY